MNTTIHSKPVYLGTGRRKKATARVRLSPGNGILTINRIEGQHYLQRNPHYINTIYQPLQILGLDAEYNINVSVSGGGLTGQTDAIKLGIARALCNLNHDNRTALKTEGYLTRDARVKERKKYGLRKARKAPQFSKR